ncbi:MAG: DNA cytosine methyltransferase [Deltaproteobacteria bacterium]|jgi:DNA (cytosine-5)-methyltransferase 1|nr:DNA cytosine methyltransferase [Deltaproteobacteria bacterium]
MNAVSLFTGCGGLDFGLEAVGRNIVYRNDSDRCSCDPLRLNGREGVQCAPLEDVSSEEIRRKAGSARDVDLVAGGPPCQPFSKRGTGCGQARSA